MTTPDEDDEHPDTPLTTDPDEQRDDVLPEDPNAGEGGAG